MVQPNYGSTSTGWTLGGTLMQPILDIPRLMAELSSGQRAALCHTITYPTPTRPAEEAECSA